MNRKAIVLLFAFTCSVVFAQVQESRKSLFYLSFISPFGTNGVQSAEYTNGVSLNLLVGVSKNEELLTIGGLSNIIRNNAKGIQIAGLSNHVGNDGAGVQCAGMVNTNKRRFSGFQLAGLLNTAKDVQGFQLGGLINVAQHVKGVQLAGLVNVAKDVQGFQLGGLINVAQNVKGVQLAALVNVANHSDMPIGLVNIIKNGEMGLAVSYDEIGNVMASFRSGGRYTYGILGVGYNHRMAGNGLVSEAGLGVHIPIVKWFRINQEVKAVSIGCTSKVPVLNVGYYLLPAFRIGRHFELFGGASLNYVDTKNRSVEYLFPSHSLWRGNRSGRLQQLYLGYQAGVQFIF